MRAFLTGPVTAGGMTKRMTRRVDRAGGPHTGKHRSWIPIRDEAVGPAIRIEPAGRCRDA